MNGIAPKVKIESNNAKETEVQTIKRMMLSEVYVHKYRKLDTSADTGEHFDVFHIYEIDETEKITPKLSTNCTEPSKIIEVLQNSTGSDTPQLIRLIGKLRTQNKKFIDIRGNKKAIESGPNAESEGSKTSPGINGNVTEPPPVVQEQPVSQKIGPNRRLTMIRVRALDSMKENDSNLNEPTDPAPIQSNNPAKQPVKEVPKIVRVKSIATNPKPVQKTINQHFQPVQPPTTVNATFSTYTSKSKPSTLAAVSSTNVVQTLATPGVKLWNNVIPPNPSNQSLDYLVVSNKEQTCTDNAVFCIKPTEEVIEHATENSSSLKIGQVFECVSDAFVEDLLVEKPRLPPPSPSPLLDSIVQQVAKTTNQNTKPNNQLVVVKPTHSSCLDYRCNICLHFNLTMRELEDHMFSLHKLHFVCCVCHDGFLSRAMFNKHLNESGICDKEQNASRPYISIVDSPISMKSNDKIVAYKCKYCGVMFRIQQHYAQHAQRHATMFRCKICPGYKPMSASIMQKHIQTRHPNVNSENFFI